VSLSQRYETIIERYETIIGWAESKAEAEAKLKLERHSHSKSLITRKVEEEEESQRSASVSASASESASTWPHVRIDACQDVDIESSNNATTAENRDGHTEHEPMKQTETLTATAREVVALLKKERDRLMNHESIIQTHRQMQTNNNSNNNAESDARPAAAVTVTVQPRHDPPGPVGPIGPGLEEKMKTKMQVSESHGNDHGDEQCHHGIEDGMLSIHDDMTSVSTSASASALSSASASHSPHGRVFQHACHNEDDSELQRRIGRRVFTSRLLRNIHKWSTYIVDEAKIEFIGRVALMFIEECKRPTEQSLIDLSQTDDGGCDVVQGFCHYYARAISCNSNNTSIVAILYTIIWPRLVELIRHQQYDINRQDKFGWSALTLLICDSAWCGAPKHKYELMESLLALGANPNQRGGQSPVYGHGGFYHEPLFAVGDPPLVYFASLGMDEMEGIELLLRYGADIHATNAKGETFMHALVSHKQLDSLRHLYSHHSTIVVTFDYTVSSYVPKLNPSGGTLFRIIDDTRLGSSLRQIDGLMFDLLNAARNKQRERFRRCLLQRTSMPSGLIGVIIDYVTPKDWKDLLHRPSDHDVKSDDEEQEDDDEDEWWR